MLAREKAKRKLSIVLMISRKEANEIMDKMVIELKSTRTI